MKIKQLYTILRYCDIFKFFKYNYCYSNIKREKNCFIIPYKHSVISINKGAKVSLKGNLYLNYNKIADSKAECYLIIGNGADLRLDGNVKLRFNSTLQVNSGAVCELGSFTTNAGVNIQCNNHLVIGNDCMMGRGVTIFDSSFHPTGTNVDNMRVSTSPVIIGDHVWLGANSSVMQGTSIGSGSIISMNANVSGEIPAASLIMAGTNKVSATGILWARGMNDISSAEKYLTALPKETNIDLPEDLVQKNKEHVLTILTRLMSGVDFKKEKELVDNKIIDSLSLMSIVTSLSNKFNIEIPYTEINANNFNSIDNIAMMLTRLQITSPVILESDSKVHKRNYVFEKLELNISDTKLSVVERIFRNSESNPDHIAIIADDKEISYSQLSDMIYSYCEYLKRIGVSKSDCVVVQAIHKVTCIALYYAVHLCGGILVPAEKTAPSHRLEEIADDVGAKLIIGIDIIENSEKWISYDYIERIQIVHKPNINSISFPSVDQPCEMVFTTGTTGKSKGVLMTHGNISWYAYSIAKCVEMKKNNRFFITTPLNHAGGLRRTHLSLANGCTVVYMDGLSNLSEYFRCIEMYNITSLYLPPVAIRILVTQTGNKLSEYADQIDFVYSSSSSLPVSDCEKMRKLLPQTRLYNAYEASETPGVSAYDYNNDNYLKNCIGKANDGVEIGIVDEKLSFINDINVEGNICIRSKMNMKEYYHAPELTEQVMNGEWFVSSDLGYINENGELFYSGRKGDVINIGGYKISPVDVEDKVLSSGIVKECVCIEEYDKLGNNYLKLLVVPLESNVFEKHVLIEYLNEKLEKYKLPREIEIVNEIQKTFNGKIDRKYYRRRV